MLSFYNLRYPIRHDVTPEQHPVMEVDTKSESKMFFCL